MARVEGKVALVAGGAGAMGSAVARLLSAEGAAILVADARIEKAEAVAKNLSGRGAPAAFTELDVRNASQWSAAVDLAEQAFGKLDVLCYVAGANRRVSFDDQTEGMWRDILETNLTGVFLGIKATIPAMRRAGSGAIVAVGSLSTIRPGASPGYSASKTGLIGLICAAASEYMSEGIRANVVSPGHVDTPFIRGNNPYSPNDWSTSIDNPKNYNVRQAASPIGRLLNPDDVAPAFLFLASDESATITGTNMVVDGGAAI